MIILLLDQSSMTFALLVALRHVLAQDWYLCVADMLITFDQGCVQMSTMECILIPSTAGLI